LLTAAAAEVALDRIPDLLGEIERLRAVRWARLTAKERSAYSGNADSRSFTSRVPRSAATCTSAFQARLLGRTWPFSQRLTVENVTPSACARSSCVSPVH